VSTLINLPPGKRPPPTEPILISQAMDPNVEMGLAASAAEIALAVIRHTTDTRVHAVAAGTLVKVLEHIPVILSKHQPLWVVPAATAAPKDK
jgi:hypothetical protein